ncbi:putative phage protein (TIGR02218 family), partial [Tepidamorphus gemmatus]
MKTLPAGMQAHLDTGTTTLAWCWKLTRTDAQVMGFTDHDRPIQFDGVIYEAASGFSASEIASSLGLSVDNLDVDGALSSAAITEADIRAGLYDGAEVEIWRVNWADPDQRVLMRRGTIGEVIRGELAFTAELRGLAQALDQTQGRTYQRICDADLGDARCKVDLDAAAFKATGSVTAATDDRILTVSGLGPFADGWFRHGRLVWTSGANAGLAGAIRADRR